MKEGIVVLSFTCLLLIAPGCAYIDQNLKVAPELSVSKSDLGHGKKIALRVVDEREDQTIGRRADGYGIRAAKISTDQDIVTILKDQFASGMHDQGFEPVGENDAKESLRVELRALSYDTAMGLWTGGNIGKSTIKIIANNSSGKTYEKSYRGQKEIRTVFVGSQETNSKVVNEALSEALNKVFEDKELWEFISQ